MGVVDKSTSEVIPHDIQVVHNSTFDEVLAYIVDYAKAYPVSEIAIASFGPVRLNKLAADYGQVLVAPCEAKASWKGRSLVQELASKLGVGLEKTVVQTDVTGAAMGELIFGNHCGPQSSLVYVTVGTGVGIGVVAGGAPLVGKLHPEGGHVLVIKQQAEANYPHFVGPCTFHKHCIENLITNNAVAERVNRPVEDLASVPDEDGVWDLIAHYLAQLCLSLVYTLSPNTIVLGGGILNRQAILPATRKYLQELNNGYVDLGDLETLVRHAAVHENGLHGCAAFPI